MAIALDADSPGGYADGVDFAAQAFAAAKKPTMALVAGNMRSAALLHRLSGRPHHRDSPQPRRSAPSEQPQRSTTTPLLAEAGIDRRVYTSSDAPEKRPDTTTEEGRAKVVSMLDGLQPCSSTAWPRAGTRASENVRANYGKGATMFAPEAHAAGMIDEIRGMDISRETAGVAGDKTAAKADGISETGGVKKMDLTEFKKDHPDLYAAVVKDAREAGKVEGITEGVAQERKRLEQLNAFRGINADGDKAVDAAIKEGKAYADVAPLLSAAVAKGSGKNADGDNPPDVATSAQDSAGGVAMNPELARMASKMGVTRQLTSPSSPARRRERNRWHSQQIVR